MRNLLWRGLALALAGCLSWTLWHWPEPPEPVEFSLTPDCMNGMPRPLPDECFYNGKLAKVTTQPDGSILLTTE